MTSPFIDGRQSLPPHSSGPAARARDADPLCILVGGSGVGKTTLSRLWAAGGGQCLPDRRTLTDLYVIPAYLGSAAGSERVSRTERIAAARAYREQRPGGMAHLIEQVPRPRAACLFDGLRGLAETSTAIRRLPDARFVALHAAIETRILRLASRGDPFDHGAGGAEGGDRLEPALGACAAALDEIGTTPGAVARRLAGSPAVDPAGVVGAIRILLAEQRAHGRQGDALRALGTLPPARRLLVDTDVNSAEETFRMVTTWWRTP